MSVVAKVKQSQLQSLRNLTISYFAQEQAELQVGLKIEWSVVNSFVIHLPEYYTDFYHYYWDYKALLFLLTNVRAIYLVPGWKNQTPF